MKQIILSAAICGLLYAPAHAQSNCSSTTDIGGSITLSTDYASTSTSNICLRVTGMNANVNCNGHNLICNNAAGCHVAVAVEQNGVVLRNCRIVSGTGDWYVGVWNGGSGGATDTTVRNIYVENAGIGVLLGKLTENSAFVNIKAMCVTSGLWVYAAGSTIQQNYCRSLDYGIVLTAPGSGAPVSVERNYVQATNIGLFQNDGLVTFSKNIVDAATDFILGDPSEATLVWNLCSDSATCEDPTTFPFSMNFTIN